MTTCDVCGKNSMLPETYGSLTLCKKCSLKILSPTWKSKTYTTNDEVETQKESTLKKANQAGYSQHALDALSSYFDNLKIAGLVKSFDGGAHQTLVVFDSHCVIDTKEDFDYEEIQEAYSLKVSGKQGCSLSSEEIDANEIISEAAKSFMSGFAKGGGLGGGVARAGASLVTGAIARSSAIHSVEKSFAAKKEAASQVNLNFIYGERTLHYANCHEVLLSMPVGEEDYGFIRFQKDEEPSPKDSMFFSIPEIATKRRSPSSIALFMIR